VSVPKKSWRNDQGSHPGLPIGRNENQTKSALLKGWPASVCGKAERSRSWRRGARDFGDYGGEENGEQAIV